ncbi:hypothetical protein VPNG_07633 [Cytospora leucostoma]|uniref:ABC transporter domain-containing protein n=1 Tax=Cytospora leucostoma TaxID=1230097 RepID=A0A423WF50_9PEZI|nr:hypothetical protein VPNG_07633 [Cytospora leucostoma]
MATSLASGSVGSMYSAEDVPQDPFYPEQIPSGAAFLDTQACLCAYRKTPVSNSEDAAWECIGNQTQGINTFTGGKWFRPLHSATVSNGSIWDASNGPDTTAPLMYNTGQNALVAVNESALSPYDAACTASNQTTFSTAFYRAVEEKRNNDTMVDAMPCYRPLAMPVQIMELETWQQKGCNEGFLCKNNTVNSLPQYCPPIDACQEARVSGQICGFQGSNIGMGPFEPVVCQGGFYCPDGGSKIKCPAGSYCQPGSAQPTSCSAVSSCPAGSVSQRFYLPLVFLIIIDVCLILGMVLLRLRKRLKKNAASHVDAVKDVPSPGLRRKVTQRIAEYNSALPDESEPWDQEASLLSADPGLNRANTGFRAALEMERGQGIQDLDDDLSHELKTFVQSMKKATDASHLGLSFRYSDLKFQPKGMSRPILQNVTGSIDRGSLTAVMGGSGAGKSTFVNVLMGKTTNTGGVVMVNDAPDRIKRYKKLIGYVPQDDIVLAELTVYENILHSARIRLPRTWKDSDIQAHVNSVIDCLELSHVRDSLVGSVGKPVISGGQRKRVSIGMELAAAPMAIFLDEPTSGLDATAASSIMKTLKAIARLGISVIVIIHQPRLEIFEMLDQLILLANGQIIYEGPEDYVQNFFENVGFTFPEHGNSGDVITDIITGNGRAYKAEGEARFNHEHRLLQPQPTVPHGLHNLNDPAMLEALKKRGAPRLKQTWLCLRRAMVQQWREKPSFWFEVVLASVCAVLLGLAQHSKDGVLFRGLYRGDFAVLSAAVDLSSAPQLSLLTGVAIGVISSAPGVRMFSEEMLLHRREAEAGHSRLAYFAAKVACVLPRMLVACMHFSTIVLVISKPVIPWGVAFLANLAYFWCIYGMAAMVSMVARREDAPLLATMASLILGILCGAAPSLAKVAQWHFTWLWRMSPGVWLAEIYFGELVRPFDYLYQTDVAAKALGFKLDWTWQNMGVLVAIGVAYRLIAFVGLFLGMKLRI